VRYHEGVAVTSRGEKYVVEKPPDWDGGSRGKVRGFSAAAAACVDPNAVRPERRA
jgi:hypothetical protein